MKLYIFKPKSQHSFFSCFTTNDPPKYYDKRAEVFYLRKCKCLWKCFPKGNINLMANVCFYKIDHHLQIWNYLRISEKIANGAYCVKGGESKYRRLWFWVMTVTQRSYEISAVIVNPLKVTTLLNTCDLISETYGRNISKDFSGRFGFIKGNII